ncbi:MAG: hypothetical protein COA42_15065 [Alteromonadaceae bacterium]|nr:MAG: hypothetical protein COA42_15065 [Alteromonadaceae bacterium]
MIKLEDFVEAIQEAILDANDALVTHSLDSLADFFEQEGGERPATGDALQVEIDNALKATETVLNEDKKLTRKALEDAKTAMGKVQKRLQSGNGAEIESLTGTLSPKMVTVKYPCHTDNDVQFKEVHVPLITLVPIEHSQLDEVKLKMELGFHLVDDQVHVNFDVGEKNRESSSDGGNKRQAVAELEITMRPSEGPAGLKYLIEGYEKMLRAQLPS